MTNQAYTLKLQHEYLLNHHIRFGAVMLIHMGRGCDLF